LLAYAWQRHLGVDAIQPPKEVNRKATLQNS
jgi:hypothetical protein